MIASNVFRFCFCSSVSESVIHNILTVKVTAEYLGTISFKGARRAAMVLENFRGKSQAPQESEESVLPAMSRTSDALIASGDLPATTPLPNGNSFALCHPDSASKTCPLD